MHLVEPLKKRLWIRGKYVADDHPDRSSVRAHGVRDEFREQLFGRGRGRGHVSTSRQAVTMVRPSA